MKSTYALAAFAAGTNALVGRSDSCCFHITASGDLSGSLGQLDDGQVRLGDDTLSASQFCINSAGYITDAAGRGCVITSETTQFQCDQGRTGTPGFSISSSGKVEFSGSEDWIACETGERGGRNIYTTNSTSVTMCKNVELAADSCAASFASSSSVAWSSFPASSSAAAVWSSAPAYSSAVSWSAGPAPVSVGPVASWAPAPSVSAAPSPSGIPGWESSSASACVPVTVTVTVNECSPSSVAPVFVPSASYGSGSQPSAYPSGGPSPGSGWQSTASSDSGSWIAPSAGSSGSGPQPSASSVPSGSSSYPSGSYIAPAPSGVPSSSPGYQPSGTYSAPAYSSASAQPTSANIAPSSAPASFTVVGSSTTSSTSASTCATTLSSTYEGNYEYPHLIIPVNSSSPDTAYGTQYFGTVSETVSTIFNFDIPESNAGMTCTLLWMFPLQKDLETSSYTFSGDGKVDFSKLSECSSQDTTYNTSPSVAEDLGEITISEGNTYVVSTFSCPAGESIAFEMKASGTTSLRWFEDWNPSPLGLFITTC